MRRIVIEWNADCAGDQRGAGEWSVLMGTEICALMSVWHCSRPRRDAAGLAEARAVARRLRRGGDA